MARKPSAGGKNGRGAQKASRPAPAPGSVRPLQNEEIALQLDEVADLLEVEGEDLFRARAFRNAARTVRGLTRSLAAMVAAGESPRGLPGIGESIAECIRELVRSGHLRRLEDLVARCGPGLAALLALPGLGPKRVRELHERLGIGDLAALEEAAAAGRVQELPGFGARTEAAILAALRARRVAAPARTPWFIARQALEPLLECLRAAPGVRRVEVAGSFRRRAETVGDLDLLALSDAGPEVVRCFTAYDGVREVLESGPTRGTVRLGSGLQVDLRVVAPDCLGSALHYFTGSKAHVIAVRRLARERGLKINEYGVFRGRRRIAGATEEEVFASVGLPYVEPELREDRGEVQAAAAGHLPRLVRLEDLRGDLHAHTRASDGSATIDEMAAGARALGHEYLAISDHTQAARIARGLDPERMAAHLDAIAAANRRHPGVRLLASAEVDILPDGALDLPDRLLARMDVVVVALHSALDLPQERQMRRVLRALAHPRVHVLAHPSARLIGERPPCALDMEALLGEAARRGVAMEVNGQPLRLDLTDVACRAAVRAGVKLALSTDAHAVHQLGHLELAVGQARRGWVGPGDVLNTLPWSELEPVLRKKVPARGARAPRAGLRKPPSPHRGDTRPRPARAQRGP